MTIVMKKTIVILSIISIIFILIFLPNISNAVLDCSKCHTNTGQAIVAKDTIEISNETCLKCHSTKYPPTPIGYNTHLAHVGKYSVKVDYLTVHPKLTESFNCGNCHVNIGSNCRNCHVINIPHITGDNRYNCKGCHGEIDKLFRHPSINLKIHDIFNLSNITACTMCHNPDNMQSLKLANSEIVSIQEPHRLCYQCHSVYYRLWDAGSHYANKTVPRDPSFKIAEIKNNWENDWRRENTCTNCHNPHSPNELYQLPGMLEGETDISNTSVLSNLYIYIIGILVLILPIIIIILKKYKAILPKLKLKLPTFNLSKIIPISISVEKIEKVEKVEKVEKIEKEDIEIKPQVGKEISNIDNVEKELERFVENIDKLDMKKTKKGFLEKYRGYILPLLIVGIILGLFYTIFGTFMPITVLISESMSPHMEKGDIIFFTDISKINDIKNDIKTYNKNDGEKSFGDYGDVILYKPNGKEGVIPIIHRAMYYVKEGENMWPGEVAPYNGYITKGDNSITNPKIDQQISTSYLHPVKDEWIVGVARFRIPYIGYIRLILPI